MDNKYLASTIDHTLLKPATPEQMKQLCEEAIKYGFASVCVLPDYVKYCADLLKNSDVKVCTVIGFPLGENITKTKFYEALCAYEDGAREVDMVINASWAKCNMWDKVQDDISAVVIAMKGKALVKVILETCLLSDEQIVAATTCVKNAGADFAKTSTGFSTGGATVHAVKLMADTLKGSNVKVKASGGVRNYAQAVEMIEAGAARLGTSNGIAIVTGGEAANNY